MTYEKLRKEAAQKGINIYEEPMNIAIKGLYGNNTIWINKHIPTNKEKSCILAEELGHFHTTDGDILDQTGLQNRKQERIARSWAYHRLIPFEKIVQAHKHGVKNRHELAEYLDVTEDFLDEAIKHYKEIYGLFKSVDGLTICFEPLGVIEMFED